MAKFKNKTTGTVVEENLIYYMEKFRKDPNYIELKDNKKPSNKEKVENEEESKEEVENTPQ